MYADKITRSMKMAMSETDRRRKKQEAYNKKHNITPTTIQKKISDVLSSIYEQDYAPLPVGLKEELPDMDHLPQTLEKWRKEMLKAAKNLDFERAAELRDHIRILEEKALKIA